MKKIGFIGLGIMGKPMALNLLKAGYSLAIHARKADTIATFAAQGVKNFDSPEKLASQVDVIITTVSTTCDVEEVLLGKFGVLHSTKPGCIVIDMSTIGANATKKIAEKLSSRDIHMLDAPVSGGEQGAIDASLTIMVGGKAEILKEVYPILEVLGKRITHVGDHGAGQTAKACNQVIIAETLVAIDEALRLAEKAGVDPRRVREALLGGFASSKVLEIHGARMLNEDYQPGFKASLHRKDMHLALELAHQVGAYLPAAKYAMQCIDQLVLKGYAHLDSSAIHLLKE